MIYLDLDETLILSMPCWVEEVAHKKIIKLSDGAYEGVKRPHADRLIQFCRCLDETKILTVSTRDYALAWNEAFQLGFEPSHIIAREDYLDYVVSAGWSYGSGGDYMLKQLKVDPDGILVDNMHHDEQWASVKRRYLGIPCERYIQITAFSGQDHDDFEQELEKIECRIRELKN